MFLQAELETITPVARKRKENSEIGAVKKPKKPRKKAEREWRLARVHVRC